MQTIQDTDRAELARRLGKRNDCWSNFHVASRSTFLCVRKKIDISLRTSVSCDIKFSHAARIECEDGASLYNMIFRLQLIHSHTMTPFDAPGKQAF